MGLFGKLFDKKICSICGGEIGLLGNRKLADGNCCKNCASQLSPWMTDRRESTVQEIKEHLAYREANKTNVARMNPTKIYGHGSKLYVDENAKCFCIAGSNDWRRNNPDVVFFKQVADIKVDINERKQELYQKDKEGKNISFDPPRYEYSYSFKIVIYVNSPYFDIMRFELSDEEPDDRESPLYFDYEKQADEIRTLLIPGCAPIGSYIAYEAEMARRNEEAARIRANIRNTAGNILHTIKPVQKPVEETWVCKCGSKNTGNFCAACGERKPSPLKKIRCNKCGWESKDGSIPKFCPNCGDPVTIDDVI